MTARWPIAPDALALDDVTLRELHDGSRRVAGALARRGVRAGDRIAIFCENRPGFVYRIVGRIKELIINGGFNVYPREVEDAIEAFRGVRACAVVGKPDSARGELPIAFVETDAPVDVEAMLDVLRGRLASFKIPKEIRFVDRLPRNAMGKLDKTALRALLVRPENASA